MVWGFPGGSDGKELPAMQETWVRSLGGEDPLEKGTATHCSILAWRIPWTEKPGRLYSPWGCKEQDTTEGVSLDGPVIKNPCSQCRGTGLISGQGTNFSHAMQQG